MCSCICIDADSCERWYRPAGVPRYIYSVIAHDHERTCGLRKRAIPQWEGQGACSRHQLLRLTPTGAHGYNCKFINASHPRSQSPTSATGSMDHKHLTARLCQTEHPLLSACCNFLQVTIEHLPRKNSKQNKLMSHHKPV